MDGHLDILRRYNIWDGGRPDTGLTRNEYVDVLSRLTGNRLVKVLTGQRRAGKSYVLRQMAMRLVENGVPGKNIFMLNRELEDFSFVTDDKDLDALFREYEAVVKPEGKVYIFIDEVQNIDGWERFVNSYSQDYMKDYELFVSGSNSKMLSGQLATLLSGRYVDIEICPFSYHEFLEYFKKERGRQSYSGYIHSSGLPELYRIDGDDTRRYYVSSLKDTILLRDIIGRYGVRDVQLLEDLFVYVVNNASNLMSVNNIANYMKIRGRKVSYDTVTAYLRYMEDAHLIHSAFRYNIKGRAVIGGAVKYYANDLAYRNYLYRGFGYGDGYLLENAVYMELRRHGCYYPACKGKCEPILRHMLQGLDVEPNPLAAATPAPVLDIVWEDPWLVAVNKPAGVLSAPGKTGQISLAQLVEARYPGSRYVHRLDMATSGLLLIAKTLTVYRQLQEMFRQHAIQKRYAAWLEGIPAQPEGTIDLPLCLDPDNRPCQTVNFQHGKKAITRYKTITISNNRTRVYFYPQTGRTHQLRVHAAHPLGLDCPIVGDELYGRKDKRLYLHAEAISFVHPVTGEKITIEKKADF